MTGWRRTLVGDGVVLELDDDDEEAGEKGKTCAAAENWMGEGWKGEGWMGEGCGVGKRVGERVGETGGGPHMAKKQSTMWV